MKIRTEVVAGNRFYYWFHCPGCDVPHSFDQSWEFNGNHDTPTFSPSLLLKESPAHLRCHLFVINGDISYLDDCTHSFAGKRIPIPEWPYDW